MAILSSVKSTCVECAIHTGPHRAMFLLLLKVLQIDCHVAYFDLGGGALLRHNLVTKDACSKLSGVINVS